jgi:O-succinylbenzoate synthase
VGPAVALRVDANGAWDLDTAVARLGALSRYGIELAEQPVASIEDLAHVRRRVAVPVAADECVRSVADAQRVRALDAADAVVLKVQPLGGVRAALEVAEAAGLPAIPTSMMETSVGIAAGLALAAALDDLPYACGLATAALLPADVTREPLAPSVDGRMRVRLVVPDADLLARYAEAIA